MEERTHTRYFTFDPPFWRVHQHVTSQRKRWKKWRWLLFACHDNKSAVGANIYIYVRKYNTLQTHLPPPTWLVVFSSRLWFVCVCGAFLTAPWCVWAKHGSRKITPVESEEGLEIACHMAWSYGEGGQADADADAEAGDGCHSRQPGDSIAVIRV